MRTSSVVCAMCIRDPTPIYRWPLERQNLVNRLHNQLRTDACQDRDLHGPSHWRSNIAYVGDGWNDRISSLIVECNAEQPSAPSLENSSDVLVPEESTGPSPFGDSASQRKDLGIVVITGV
jgi:hypothetical protein